jgi:hypothetical protein
MLPILIEEDTVDVSAVVRRKISAWTNEPADSVFIDTLLREGRLMVIVDRLSERSPETIQHIKTIHGLTQIRVMVVTSRRYIEVEAGNVLSVFPQPLNSETLLFFMTSLLHLSPNSPFKSVGSQIDLASRIASLIHLGEKRELPITPLLARLYIDRAVMLAGQKQALDDLPKTIPDAYFEYLRGINPSGTSVTNRLSDEQMLRAAEALARLSLGESFMPSEFSRKEARSVLTLVKEIPIGTDPIERLVENGVLVEYQVGSSSVLSFLLDPIAEYLAAMAWARECGRVEERWRGLCQSLIDLGRQADGFEVALHSVVQAYGQRLGWFKTTENETLSQCFDTWREDSMQ